MLQSPPAGQYATQQSSVEAGLGQLQLQGSGDAGRAASASRDSSSYAGELAAGAAGGSSAAAGEEVVSQSRASSQIRIKKFHKLLNEQVVSAALAAAGGDSGSGQSPALSSTTKPLCPHKSICTVPASLVHMCSNCLWPQGTLSGLWGANQGLSTLVYILCGFLSCWV